MIPPMAKRRPRTESPQPGPLTPLEPPAAEGAAEVVLSAEEIHARAKAREDEFTAMIERHSRLLHAFVRGWVKRDQVDDVVQEVLSKAWDSEMIAKCGGDDGRIEAYLRQSVRNRVFNEQRHDKRDRNALARCADWVRALIKDPERSAQRTIASEIEQLLTEAIWDLPPHYRDPFMQVRVLHKKRKKVAEELHMKVGTVGVYVRRGHRLVQQSLAAHGYGRDPESQGKKKENTP
jgi:RNA polymerase sigma factor (sigma-70 family)